MTLISLNIVPVQVRTTAFTLPSSAKDPCQQISRFSIFLEEVTVSRLNPIGPFCSWFAVQIFDSFHPENDVAHPIISNMNFVRTNLSINWTNETPVTRSP